MYFLLRLPPTPRPRFFSRWHYSNKVGEDVPAIAARYDEDGDLKSATRMTAAHSAERGLITSAKLTVSGGE